MIFTIKTLKNGKWKTNRVELDISPDILYNNNLCIINIDFGIFRSWAFDTKTFDKRIVTWS
jgi:hypothetical protein